MDGSKTGGHSKTSKKQSFTLLLKLLDLLESLDDFSHSLVSRGFSLAISVKRKVARSHPRVFCCTCVILLMYFTHECT